LVANQNIWRLKNGKKSTLTIPQNNTPVIPINALGEVVSNVLDSTSKAVQSALNNPYSANGVEKKVCRQQLNSHLHSKVLGLSIIIILIQL
jgi:hypothetical protein